MMKDAFIMHRGQKLSFDIPPEWRLLTFATFSDQPQPGDVYDIITGDPIHAHLAGIEKSKGIISQRFAKKSDLTLITSFPYTEGPQIVKPLVPASMVTKEGGCIILAAECTGNLPDAFVDSFEMFHSEYGDNLLRGVLQHFENNRSIMEGGAFVARAGGIHGQLSRSTKRTLWICRL